MRRLIGWGRNRRSRNDIASIVASVARVATTAGAFAYCGWIVAGDAGAGILGIAVIALLIGLPTASASGKRVRYRNRCPDQRIELSNGH